MSAGSKAARIRKLYAEGNPCKEIARIIGCRVEYARVCAQQRAKGYSKADEQYMKARYNAPTLREAQRRHRAKMYANPVKKAQHLKYMREYMRERRQLQACTDPQNQS